MPTVNQTKPEATNKSLEMDIERNVHESLRRVYEASTCEIDNLISELRGLREKLETDCDHIQSDIAEYAKLSEGVVQLTAIISDGVEKLPSAPRMSQ